MAKFSRFLLGGMVGAGLALVFSPKSGKEIRRMLTGGGRKALPPVEGYSAPSDFSSPAAPAPAAAAPPPPAPSAPAAAPPAPDAGADLQSRIEETRRRLAAQMSEAFPAAPEAETVPLAPEAEAPAEEPSAESPGVETTDLGEAASVEPGEVEPEFAPAGMETSPAAPLAAAPEPAPEAALGAEPPAPGVTGEAEPAPAEEVKPAAGEAVPREAEAAGAVPVEEPAAASEAGWEALKTPAEGEPVITGGESAMEADLTISGDQESFPSPAGIDRDEMRRRIDETRARLKAKAFDAMVSGETFIDSGQQEAAGGAPPTGIDKQTEDQIDEALKEED